MPKQQRATKDSQPTREEPPVKEGKLPCTGKISVKVYKCTRCGKEQNQATNHWGHTYGTCTCGHHEWECQEPVPEGMGVPEKWRLCRLGDVADIS